MSLEFPARIRNLSKTTAAWAAANTILLAGEIGLESDTRKIKVGDGTTAWNSLAYGGIAGAAGAAGATGPAGAAGTNGTNGAAGATGAAGPTGAAGTNGTNGAAGAAGPNTISGATTSALVGLLYADGTSISAVASSGTGNVMRADSPTATGTLTATQLSITGGSGVTNGLVQIGSNLHVLASGAYCFIADGTNGGLGISGSYAIRWGTSTNLYGHSNVFRVEAANGIAIRNIGNSADADLTLRSMLASGPIAAGVYTFATVPAAGTYTGYAIRISDRSQKWAYSDGTNFRFFVDGAIIS